MIIIKKFKITTDTFEVDENHVRGQVEKGFAEKYGFKKVTAKHSSTKIDGGNLYLVFECKESKPMTAR